MIFPEIEPKQQGRLKVSPLHSIYWEISGNPEGAAILIVHGGPGGGSSQQTLKPKSMIVTETY